MKYKNRIEDQYAQWDIYCWEGFLRELACTQEFLRYVKFLYNSLLKDSFKYIAIKLNKIIQCFLGTKSIKTQDMPPMGHSDLGNVSDFLLKLS